MIIGSRYRLSNLESNPVITIGQSNIKRVTNKKSLGLILDNQLKWKTHIDKHVQCKKTSENIALLKRACKTFSADAYTRLKMFNAFVLPSITNCSTVWNDGTSSIIEKLTKLQGRAARAITGESYEVRSTDILQKLNWVPIEKILMKRETIMTFKALTGRLHARLSSGPF